MDANAYLRKQGWRGSGHSLDKTGRGIKKPLLISHKQDQLGLGKKKAAHNVSDQWWMRAFDASLQNIGTGQDSALDQVRTQGINRGGLYGFFVRGEGLAGTITSSQESSGAEASNSSASLSDKPTPPTSEPDTEVASDSSNLAIMARRGKTQKRKRRRETEANPPKKQKTDKANTAASETDEHSFDEETLNKCVTVVKSLENQVKRILEKAAKRGEYGFVVDPKLRKGRKGRKDTGSLMVDDPENPGKQISFKDAKVRREKRMRDARPEVWRQKIVSAVLKGDLPNPNNYSKQEALARFGEIEKMLKAIAKQDANAKKEQKAQRKIASQEARREKKEHIAATKQAKSDKKPVEKDTNATEKGNAVYAKLAKLTKEERTQWEERAAEKGQTLKDYTLRRIEKKASKHSTKNKRATNPDEALEPVTTGTDLFFVDLEGDKALADASLSLLNKTPLPADSVAVNSKQKNKPASVKPSQQNPEAKDSQASAVSNKELKRKKGTEEDTGHPVKKAKRVRKKKVKQT